MELYTIRYVLAIAEYGNFSKAAQACFVGQPALSQQVSRLEQELGVTLFDRTPRGVVLTPAGREFVARGRKLVQDAETLTSEMGLFAGGQRGTLNLGIISSLQCIGFGSMLSAFSRDYPEISVNIREEGSYQLITMLEDREIDAAFLNLPPSGIPGWAEYRILGTDSFSLAMPASHPLAGKSSIPLASLKDESFIFHNTGQVAYELCMNACRKAGFTPRIVCRTSSPTTTFYMVQGGLGIAILPSEEFRSRTIEGVTEVRITDEIIKTVGIAWRRDTSSPIVHTITDFASRWKQPE